MSNKRLFQILDEMNVQDIESGTGMVSMSPHFISANLTKQGTVVTMGAGAEVAQQLSINEKMALLVIVDRNEFQKLKKK